MSKNFQETKLFICHCSFITLAQNTIVTTGRKIIRNTSDGLLPSLELELKRCFYIFHWIAIHFLIHYLPFRNFAVCSSFSWLVPSIKLYSSDEVFCACFQLVYSFLFSLKKWAYLKYERVMLYSNDRHVGFSSQNLSFFFLKL